MKSCELFVLLVVYPHMLLTYNCPPCICVNILISDRCVDRSDGMPLKNQEYEGKCQHYITRKECSRHVPRSSPCTDCSTTPVQYEGWKCDSVGEIVYCLQLHLTVLNTHDGPVCRGSSTACDGGWCLWYYTRSQSRLCVANKDEDDTVTGVNHSNLYTKGSQTPASSDQNGFWEFEAGSFFSGTFVGAALTIITFLVVLCYNKRCNHGASVSLQTRSWTASPSQVVELQDQIRDLQKILDDVLREIKHDVERTAGLENELKKVRQQLQELLKMTKEDPIVSPTIYNEDILNKIRPLFVTYVIPGNILHMFHHYNSKVLVQQDIERVEAVTRSCGPTAGASELLKHLIRYKDWFGCLLLVLRNPQVKQDHVADEMSKALDC